MVAHLERAQIALRVARDLQPGWYVNLGVGIPVLLADSLANSEDFVLHSENGLLGIGSEATGQQRDDDLVDAGGRFTTLGPGASLFDSATSFAMLRGGHIDAAVIGAFQVSAVGDLANWNVPGQRFGGIGGAADIGASVPNLFVTMSHTTRDGAPKIVRECTYPLTAVRAVTRIYTDIAVISVTANGLRLDEAVPGYGPEDVQAVTDAPLHWNDPVRPLTV
jgi:3-oxoadipate CoA-transferase beta subunit